MCGPNISSLVVDNLERLPLTRGILTRDGAPQVIAGTVIVLLPQLLIALAGGLLALPLARAVEGSALVERRRSLSLSLLD